MARDNREVEAKLLSKFAFAPAPTRNPDHRWVQLTLPGLPAILTKFSHTREDIGPSLWKKIATQLRVQSNYLNGMIDCTKNREDYYRQVRTDPHPPWNHLMQGTAMVPKAQPTRKKKSRKK